MNEILREYNVSVAYNYCNRYRAERLLPMFLSEILGLKMIHKRITTKVVLPVSKSRVRVLYGGGINVQLSKVGRYRVRNQRG